MTQPIDDVSFDFDTTISLTPAATQDPRLERIVAEHLFVEDVNSPVLTGKTMQDRVQEMIAFHRKELIAEARLLAAQLAGDDLEGCMYHIGMTETLYDVQAAYQTLFTWETGTDDERKNSALQAIASVQAYHKDFKTALITAQQITDPYHKSQALLWLAQQQIKSKDFSSIEQTLVHMPATHSILLHELIEPLALSQNFVLAEKIIGQIRDPNPETQSHLQSLALTCLDYFQAEYSLPPEMQELVSQLPVDAEHLIQIVFFRVQFNKFDCALRAASFLKDPSDRDKALDIIVGGLVPLKQWDRASEIARQITNSNTKYLALIHIETSKDQPNFEALLQEIEAIEDKDNALCMKSSIFLGIGERYKDQPSFEKALKTAQQIATPWKRDCILGAIATCQARACLTAAKAAAEQISDIENRIDTLLAIAKKLTANAILC